MRSMAIAVWLLLAGPIFAEPVNLPAHQRVYNPDERCFWCSLEMLAKAHGIGPLRHISQRHADFGGWGAVFAELRQPGIVYGFLPLGERDIAYVEHVCGQGWGAVIGLSGTHAVVLVELTATEAWIIDPSDSKLRTQHWTRQQFLDRWDGMAVAVWPTKPLDAAPSGVYIPVRR